MRNKNTDEDYEIEAVSKALLVLEALEGIHFEPVSFQTVMTRTGFSRDFVSRALRTLKINGYAIQENRRWMVGKKFIRLANSASRNCV